MGRHYQRKTEKGADGVNYTKEHLNLANGNISVYGAAKRYNIPRTTLRHYINGTRGHKGIVAEGGRGGGGKLAIDFDVEHKLAMLLTEMQKWGYGLSREEVLDLVQSYIKQNKIKTRFRDDRPGEEWFLQFCKRHKMSIKKPQAVEIARKKQENPWTIYGFFDLLEKAVADLGLKAKPELIFNCDETSFSSDQKPKLLVKLEYHAQERFQRLDEKIQQFWYAAPPQVKSYLCLQYLKGKT